MSHLYAAGKQLRVTYVHVGIVYHKQHLTSVFIDIHIGIEHGEKIFCRKVNVIAVFRIRLYQQFAIVIKDRLSALSFLNLLRSVTRVVFPILLKPPSIAYPVDLRCIKVLALDTS